MINLKEVLPKLKDVPGFAVKLNYLGPDDTIMLLKATEFLFRSRKLTEEEELAVFYIRRNLLNGIEKAFPNEGVANDPLRWPVLLTSGKGK